MATGDRESQWRRDTVALADGLHVERDTLIAKPTVQMYLFNLRKRADGERAVAGVARSLATLWDQPKWRQPTLVLPGAPIDTTQSFSRDQLVRCLVELLQKHRPTVVRTLDPDPERGPEKTGFAPSDHVDHTATARFALRAVHDFCRTGGQPPAIEHYRAYANRFWPYNLSEAAHAEKARFLLTYAGADGSPCPGNDCGDYQLGPNPYRSTHIFSTADRYSPTTTWMARRSDGALVAFATLGGRAAYWTQTAPASDAWMGPTFLEGYGIAPSLTVVAGPDGRTHVVGLRRAEATGAEVTVDVVHAVSPAPSAPFGPWRSLDGPDSTDPERRKQREVGVPAAAVDAAGRLCVFVRDYGQGLSMRRESDPGAGWEKWEALDGAELQDAPTALTTSSGRVEVYVPGKRTIYRWYQAEPNGAFIADTGLRARPVATGGVTAVESSRDRITLYYRQARTAKVLAYRQRANQEGWPSNPAELGGHEGTGAVAVACRPGSRGARELLVAHRNADGAVTVGFSCGTTGSAPVTWTAGTGPVVHAPAIVLDHDGRAVLAVVGVDGRLHVARETGPEHGAGFGEWMELLSH
jgi:LmbE family N-acetylglucosaminyl deacetylase